MFASSACTDIAFCAAETRAERSLADHLSVSTTELAVATGEAVVWPDGGLKCWVEGHAYTAAEEPGFRFVVALNAKPYFVHISTEFGST